MKQVEITAYLASACASAALIGFALSTASPALADSPCAARSMKVISDSTSRCRASFIEIETTKRSAKVSDGDGAFCFKPPAPVWKWNCRGYEEVATCRSDDGADYVSAQFSKGEVLWKCYGK